MSNLGYPFEIETLEIVKSLEVPMKIGVDEEGNDILKYKSYRVYGSGMNKNSINLDPTATLDGDIIGELQFLPKKLQIECKHHKSRKIEKSLAVEKKWLDENNEEAEKNGNIPMLAFKFKNAKKNNIHFVISKDYFLELMNYIKDLYEKNKAELPLMDIKEVSSDELIEELKRRIS